MKRKVGIVVLLSLLLLSLPVVSVAGAADGDKAVIKEMVQAPGDYGVGICYFGDFDRIGDMWVAFSRYNPSWFDR